MSLVALINRSGPPLDLLFFFFFFLVQFFFLLPRPISFFSGTLWWVPTDHQQPNWFGFERPAGPHNGELIPSHANRCTHTTPCERQEICGEQKGEGSLFGVEGGVGGSSTTASNLMRLSVFLHGCTGGKCRNGLTHDSQFHPRSAPASFVLSPANVGRVEISRRCRVVNKANPRDVNVNSIQLLFLFKKIFFFLSERQRPKELEGFGWWYSEAVDEMSGLVW